MGVIRSGLHIYSDRPIEGTSTPPLPPFVFQTGDSMGFPDAFEKKCIVKIVEKVYLVQKNFVLIVVQK